MTERAALTEQARLVSGVGGRCASPGSSQKQAQRGAPSARAPRPAAPHVAAGAPISHGLEQLGAAAAAAPSWGRSDATQRIRHSEPAAPAGNSPGSRKKISWPRRCSGAHQTPPCWNICHGARDQGGGAAARGESQRDGHASKAWRGARLAPASIAHGRAGNVRAGRLPCHGMCPFQKRHAMRLLVTSSAAGASSGIVGHTRAAGLLIAI